MKPENRVTNDGRELVICGDYGPEIEKRSRGGAVKHHIPRCNKVRGHDGSHAEVKQRDFSVVASWANVK